MINKIKNFFYIIFFLVFLSLIINFYFSENNIIATNKSRTFYSLEKKSKDLNLTILKNDTEDVIEYNDDINAYKKSKKKYKFWDLINE